MQALYRQDRLEASAIEWLRFERQCQLVALERGVGVGTGVGRPDVFGVDKRRFTIEIEIKRSVSDFRADKHKRVSEWRASGTTNVRQFYYLMPTAVADKVFGEIPQYAGLLCARTEPGPEGRVSGYTQAPLIVLSRKAPANPNAKRLTIEECIRMVRHQTSTMLRILSANHGLLDRIAAFESSDTTNK